MIASGAEITSGPALLESVGRLARPRRAGSEGDRDVRRHLAAVLEAGGFEVEEEVFSFSSRPALNLFRAAFVAIVVADLLSAIGGGLGELLLALGWLAAAAGLLALVARWDGLYRLGSGESTTANVVVRAGSTEPSRRLVLVAHHDSKSQNLPFLARGLAAGLLAVGFAGQAALAAAFITGAASEVGPLTARLACGAGAVGAGLLAALTFGNRSPGALDNGGSVAVVLATIRILADSLPRGTEVMAVFTGAEEDLLVGARVLRHRLDALPEASSLVINLDGVGARGATGLLGPRRLKRWAAGVARRGGLPVRSLPALPGAATDALVLGRGGRAVLTLSSSRPDRAVRAIHTPADLPENLDSRALARAQAVLEALSRDFLEGADGSW